MPTDWNAIEMAFGGAGERKLLGEFDRGRVAVPNICAGDIEWAGAVFEVARKRSNRRNGI